ncbi:paraneoplastic antigen Ma6E-like [Drosophila gunungcola]|uniref:paraneoplastic antigen Ma6E-like n=1 Tax=Drosophila gunungcola TaxID=103775 RepID=UPI0022E52143|nr:paraneoplastic antigen Ma6E-like [Drosophila gunungcola]
MPPSGKPKEWARILEARAVTVRQWETRRAARSAAFAAWQQRLRDAEAEEAALAAAVGNAAAATVTTCADATTTATTTLTITTTIVAAEAAGVTPATGAGRASAADHRGGGAAVSSEDGHVDVARARGGSRGGPDAGGHRGHRVAAPTAVEPARAEGQVGETRRGDGRSRGPGGAGEGAMGVAITAGDVAGRGATTEAGAADFVPGDASPTGEAGAAKTAVGGRGTVGGGSGGDSDSEGGRGRPGGPSSCWRRDSTTESR